MTEKLVEIFNIEIVSPISRKQVREVVKAKNNFIQKIVDSEDITYQQASLDAEDIVENELKKLDQQNKEIFLRFYIEEMGATHNLIDNDIVSKSDAQQYHLRSEFIFHQLSANLQVYGSNAPTSGANPAKVDLALEYINKSLDLDPNNPIYLNLKGLLLWQGKGEKIEGSELIEKAAKLDPTNITIQHNLKNINESKESKDCFIATAAYGTPLAVEINELRVWRDTKLTTYFFGRKFIKYYYRLSPPVANFISKRQRLRACIRFILKPIIIIVTKINSMNKS